MPSSRGLRLSIHLGADDHWHHKPTYHEVVRRAHEAGLAGATVLQGVEGYGRTGTIHTERILSLADDLPLVVLVVDTEDRIRAFLPELEDIAENAAVVLDEVEFVHYGPDAHS